jgi:hypothetical protein
MSAYLDFFSGFQAAAFLVCALFFLRFWRRAGEELFLAFAFAFLLLALQQILIVFLGLPEEERGWVYVLRLVAFLAIIAAIVRKNFSK